MQGTVGIFLVTFVLVGTLVPVYLHHQEHGVYNPFHMGLAFFLPLNMLICYFEVALGIYIDKIKLDYKAQSKVWTGKEFDSIIDFFYTPLTLGQLVTPKYWTRVWSTYSLYDPSYSNKESFGFFVDVSNGWCFLLPSALFLYAMTYNVESFMNIRTLACIGLVSFWVMMHGTCIYFLSFFMNGRHKRFTAQEVALFIGGSNGLWFFFPLLGVYVCYDMIQTGTMDIVRS